jgi:hypothetical protein
MDHLRVCKVTFSADPASADWALWYMEKEMMMLSNCVPNVIQIAVWMLIMQTIELKSLQEVVFGLD